MSIQKGPNWRQKLRKEELKTDRRESIAGVGNQHASFADSAVADGDALDESGRTHFSSSEALDLSSTPKS